MTFLKPFSFFSLSSLVLISVFTDKEAGIFCFHVAYTSLLEELKDMKKYSYKDLQSVSHRFRSPLIVLTSAGGADQLHTTGTAVLLTLCLRPSVNSITYVTIRKRKTVARIDQRARGY